MDPREFDVVLYGATGFTGRQTVSYFARRAGTRVRWAIAGRNQQKLEAVRAAAGEGARHAPVIVADSANQGSLDSLAPRTRVLLTTAGPFALYGTPVVDACVRHRTGYVDITGETAWVRDLITRYHARAAADGTRVIPFCGFDSVPSDLGTFLLARHMQRATGVSCSEVRSYFRLAGGLNGGTIASMVHMLDTKQQHGMRDPFLLRSTTSPSERQIARSRGQTGPRYDKDAGRWTGPFFMAPTNTRVVRRSAALYDEFGEPYGPDFVYRESLEYGGRLAAVKSAVTTLGLGLFFVGLKGRLTRRAIMPFLPGPGEGPSEKTMNTGWFACELMGFARDGRTARGVMHYAGDPGNRATVTLVCESALTLALDTDALPGGPSRGGVLTPATALGDPLAARLRAAGVNITIGSAGLPPSP